MGSFSGWRRDVSDRIMARLDKARLVSGNGMDRVGPRRTVSWFGMICRGRDCFLG